MGNEMGNRNVSGLQEEENAATEAPEKSQEIAHSDVEKGENQTVPAAEDKDFHEKVEGLSSDEPSHTDALDVEKQNLNGREQDDTELKPPSEFLEVPIEPNDAISQDNQNQETSSTNDGEHLEKPIESNLEQNDILGVSDHQIQKEMSVGRELQESSVNPNYGNRESSDVQAEPIVENHNGSPQDSDEILKTSPSYEGDEKGHLLETEDTHSISDQGVVSDTIPEVEKKSDDILVEEDAFQDEKANFEENCENKSEDEVRNNKELPTEMMLSQLDSFKEVTEPHEKCMIASGPTMEENWISEQLSNESKSEKVSDSQSNDSNSMLAESYYENGKESLADSPSEDGMEKESQLKEGKEMAPEIGTVPTELTVTEGNLGEENSKKRIVDETEKSSENSNKIGSDREDHKHYSILESETVEAGTFSVTNMKLENSKGEKSEFENGVCETKSSMGRFSTESNSENMNTHLELRKSPSFDFDLSLEARFEESDQTPLLHHDKTSTRSFDINFGNSITRTEHGEEKAQYEAMPVEEKTIRMERSDSEKSRTPFLSLLKEDEQTHVVVSPQKQDSHVDHKEIVLASSKGGGRRKPRSFLFSNCICCAAAIP